MSRGDNGNYKHKRIRRARRNRRHKALRAGYNAGMSRLCSKRIALCGGSLMAAASAGMGPETRPCAARH